MNRLATHVLAAALLCTVALPGARAGFPFPGPKSETPDTGDVDAQVKNIYDTITFETDEIGYRRGAQYFLKQGVQGRMLVKAKNPDPAWILQWPLSSQGATGDAAMQAAVNRTWLPSCEKAFGVLWQDSERLRAELEPELAAAQAIPDFYARIPALRALVEKVDGMGNRGFAADVGVAATIHKAYIDAFAVGKRAWLASAYFPKLAHGRPARDEAAEKALFCATAKWSDTPMRGGVKRLPELLEERTDWDVVRWPGASRAETQALAAASDKAEKGFWATTPAGVSVPNYSVNHPLDFDAADPKLAFVQGKVTAVQADGQIAITEHGDFTEAYDCVRTNRVLKIEHDGTLVYEEKCKHKAIKENMHFTLTPAEMPPGITVQKGDYLGVYVDVTADAPKTLVDTKASLVRERRGAGVIRHVRRLARNDTPIFAFE